MSEIDPGEVLNAGPQMEESYDPPPPDPPPSTSSKEQEREGLPPNYRMRADAHYVDQLTSRGGERTSSEASRGGDPLDAPAGRDDRLLEQLTEDLATIESAAGVLAGEASRMARRVNVDLIRSHVWRAAWALRARAIVDGAYRFQIRPRPLAFLLGHVRTGWTAECRLADLTLDVRASDWNAVVSVDEGAVMAALTGALIGTLGLIGETEGTVLTVEAVAGDGVLRSVDVVQQDVLIAPAVGARFFDASWTDRPGGWLAALGASTARTVARRHGGDAVFLIDEAQGSTVRINLARNA